MAAITIDSPRWRDGWGESIRHAPPARPELRVVTGSGSRRTDAAVLRRRRLVALAAAIVVIVALLVGASSLLSSPASAGAPAVGRVTHLVQPGETYWSIAAGLEHRGDLRIFVDRLVDANGGRTLVAGDRIEVPQP
jgi:hypothetical protein